MQKIKLYKCTKLIFKAVTGPKNRLKMHFCRFANVLYLCKGMTGHTQPQCDRPHSPQARVFELFEGLNLNGLFAFSAKCNLNGCKFELSAKRNLNGQNCNLEDKKTYLLVKTHK